MLTCLAAVPRVYWATRGAAVLEIGGCEYARIAENLVERGAYVGLFEGPELVFPPFFPALLAFGMVFMGTVDHAARLVPLVAGILLVPAMYALARLVYGLRVALVAAVLAAGHPVLVWLSGAADSESVYLPLSVAGLYWGLRSIASKGPAPAALAGVCFGLAYLTRPEALFYPVVIALAVLLAGPIGGSGLREPARRALWLIVPVVVLAGPYVAYLSVETGRLQFSGKGLMNHTIGVRENAGMRPHEATLGLGPGLEEEGPQLSPNLFLLSSDRRLDLGSLAGYWLASTRRNRPVLFAELIEGYLYGSVLMVALVTIGLIRHPWSRARLIREGVLLAVGLGHVLLLLGAHHIMGRYVLVLVPLILLWTAKGIDETAAWAVATARRTLALRRVAGWLGAAVRWGLVVALLVLAARGASWTLFRAATPDTPLVLEAASWLDRHRPGPKRVMANDLRVPCYAHGAFLPLPYADPARSLSYVRRKAPDFIVLVRSSRYYAPYLREWAEEGIPDAGARLIYRRTIGPEGAVAIYAWKG